jgi:hypothetical protein
MIAEMQTYDLKSRSPAVVEARFKAALPERAKLSPFGAFWHTEVGVLNRVILVWPYASEDERARVHAQEQSVSGWPPQIDEFVVARETRVYTLAPFSPAIEPRELGKLYEIRSYTYPTTSIPEVIRNWSEFIDERVKWSPLVGAWHAQRGDVSDWVHIWAYRDAGERERIRAEVSRLGVWPMSAIDRRLKREPSAVSLSMQNMLVLPASFSPLR